MNTIRCDNCEHENPSHLFHCEKCHAELNATVEISKVDTDTSRLVQASIGLQEKKTSEETLLIRDKLLSKSKNEWEEMLAQYQAEDLAESDGDAGEESNPTNILPPLEDENSEQRIGAVRFKGDLVLKHQATEHEFVIVNALLQEATIGRLDKTTDFIPTIDLTNFGGKDKGVSRRHATITIRGELLLITDHNSVNGTFLNGQRLVPEQARVLRDTDILRIGRIDLLVHFKS